MDKNRDLNWAVLGTGVIANEMAQALVKMNKRLYAVANRTHQKAFKNALICLVVFFLRICKAVAFQRHIFFILENF